MEEALFSRIKIISSFSPIQVAWVLRLSIINQTFKWDLSLINSKHIQWWGNKIRMKECLNIGWVQTIKCIIKISRWASHLLIKWYLSLLCNTNIKDSPTHIKISQWCLLLKVKQAHLIHNNLCSSTHQHSPKFIIPTNRCRLLLFNNINKLLLNLNTTVEDLHKVRLSLQVLSKN